MAKCPSCGAEVNEDAHFCLRCGALTEAHTLITPTGLGDKEVLCDRYVLLSLLGRGGMGAVWLAKDVHLDEVVAVKTLPQEVAGDLRAVEWMKEEARLARALRHDNIAAIYNFELDHGRGVSFIVMEFINGADLHTLLAPPGGSRVGLPLSAVLEITSQAAEALDYAHAHRVVHRDLKPKNVMLSRDGVVKVTDFGIARRLRETMSRISQTVVSGTPAYMSPEALEGGKIDHRADIYSLGVTVYELLTGAPPFSGVGVEVMYRIMKGALPALEPTLFAGDETMAERVTEVLRKCMAKSPEERYGSAKEFDAALREAGAGVKAGIGAVKEDVVKIASAQRRMLGGASAGRVPRTVTPPPAGREAGTSTLISEARAALEAGDFDRAAELAERASKSGRSVEAGEILYEAERLGKEYWEHVRAGDRLRGEGNPRAALVRYRKAYGLRKSTMVRKRIEELEGLVGGLPRVEGVLPEIVGPGEAGAPGGVRLEGWPERLPRPVAEGLARLDGVPGASVWLLVCGILACVGTAVGFFISLVCESEEGLAAAAPAAAAGVLMLAMRGAAMRGRTAPHVLLWLLVGLDVVLLAFLYEGLFYFSWIVVVGRAAVPFGMAVWSASRRAPVRWLTLPPVLLLSVSAVVSFAGALEYGDPVGLLTASAWLAAAAFGWILFGGRLAGRFFVPAATAAFWVSVGTYLWAHGGFIVTAAGRLPDRLLAPAFLEWPIAAVELGAALLLGHMLARAFQRRAVRRRT